MGGVDDLTAREGDYNCKIKDHKKKKTMHHFVGTQIKLAVRTKVNEEASEALSMFRDQPANHQQPLL